MTNRSDKIKAHLNAKKLNEDAAGDVLRATVAKHKLKDMEGTKKSQALIDKLTKRVAAGKRHMTEEAIKKAVKPAPKPTKILTNNPGYGYHAIAHTKHKGDTNKAHAEYNRMHAKVKDWAGEAGHLMHAKKPNLMVRDYLDSSRGRHLEGLQADEKYIKKDFGHFARSYDPKLFVESLEVTEGIGSWAVDKLTDYSVNKGKKDHRPDIIKDQSEKLRSEGLKHVTARYDQGHMYHKKAIDAWHAVVDHAAKAKTIGEFQKRAKNIGNAHETLINHDGPHSPLRTIKEETLNETTRSQDAQRVQYGVMKRDDYLRKWKIGKFGEKKNSLAGPGGLYKNLLVGSNIDNKSAATKK